MEAKPTDVVSPAAEPRAQYPTSNGSHKGQRVAPKNDVTLVMLLFIALFVPPLSVFFITSCDGQFALNVILWFLTFGIASFFHALFVIFYYGKSGRPTWKQRKQLVQQRLAALEFTADTQPPQVRSEAYADAPPYSAYGGGHGIDSKYS